jgi:hypothetical protein
VVIDQFLLETEPDECELMLTHLASAVPVYVNCGTSGAERIAREVRSALSRRQREEQAARRSAEQAIWSELNESITAMLLSCDLALSSAGMPAAAAEKIRAARDQAAHIRWKSPKRSEGRLHRRKSVPWNVGVRSSCLAKVIGAPTVAKGILHRRGPTFRAGFSGSSNARHGLDHFGCEAAIGFRNQNGPVHQPEHGQIVPAVS